MRFKAKEKPRFEERKKVFGYTAVRKCVMKKEAGAMDDGCKKMFEEMGIEVIDE